MKEAGDGAEAGALMVQLAPLSEGTIQPRGYAQAHLWMAKHYLGAFTPEFLQVFPLNATEGKPSEVPITLQEEDKTFRAQRHLEHAIALAPELGDAPLLLSAVWMARGKRAAALEVLIRAIAHPTDPHPELQVSLSNLLTYEGDDLAMEEKAWLSLTVLGRKVSKSHARDDFYQRMEYALNALILKKFEMVASVLRKMERDFSNSEKFPQAAGSIAGLRMAVLYRQAVMVSVEAAGQSGAGAASMRMKLVEALGKVLEVQPDHLSVINALSSLLKANPELGAEIKELIEKAAQASRPAGSVSGDQKDAVRSEGASAAKSHLILSALTDGDAEKTKKHLEAALQSTPNDPDVLMGLASLLSKEEKPDHSRVVKLSTDAIQLKNAQSGGHAGPDDYLIQGRALLALGQWQPSIIALEKALSSHPDQRLMHQLLAKAYRGAGRPKLAKMHEERGE